MHTMLFPIISAILFSITSAAAIHDNDYTSGDSLDIRSAHPMALPEPFFPLLAIGARMGAKIAAKKIAKKIAKKVAQKVGKKAAQKVSKKAGQKATKKVGKEAMRKGREQVVDNRMQQPQQQLNQKRALSVRDVEILEFLLMGEEVM